MPSRARCQLCPLDARRAPRWQVAQLPTDELHALLEAVQPLLKSSRKAKAPPAKSGGTKRGRAAVEKEEAAEEAPAPGAGRASRSRR